MSKRLHGTHLGLGFWIALGLIFGMIAALIRNSNALVSVGLLIGTALGAILETVVHRHKAEQ